MYLGFIDASPLISKAGERQITPASAMGTDHAVDFCLVSKSGFLGFPLHLKPHPILNWSPDTFLARSESPFTRVGEKAGP